VLRQRRSINERMVREGWALDYRKYSTELTSSATGGV
jgi:endonuclease YncB( thermonuclease family)